MSISITEKKIKSKIKIDGRVAVVENIKYPYFECTRHKKLCDKMNAFYSGVAEKYSFHARRRLPKKIKSKLSRYKLPLSVSMNYTIALNDEKIVSVVLDLLLADGKNIKTRRFSQMWSVKKGDILPIFEVVNTDKNSRKKIISLVMDAARENAKKGTFGYFDDYAPKISKNIDVSNCFAVPKGLCFFINSGIVSPVKYGCAGFVLSKGELGGVIKEDFLNENEDIGQ